MMATMLTARGRTMMARSMWRAIPAPRRRFLTKCAIRTAVGSTVLAAVWDVLVELIF